jgi:CxxC motif-containing protein (DUF1111 family)
MKQNLARPALAWTAITLVATLVGCISLLPPPPTIGTEFDLPATGAVEAPTGFDSQSNGVADPATFSEDLLAFDQAETLADGLGPLYNAQSCRECHQSPVSGAASQVSELRVGHRDARGRFQNPRIPIARGTVFIEGRTLVNDRAICPNGQFTNDEIQERVPDTETIRAFRMSLSVLGDGFVEAVDDQALRDLAARQCSLTQGRICGRLIDVPVLEAPGKYRPGRFGWKSQQASLLSFAADAYLNEMGITSRLLPDEVTTICDAVADPEDTPETAASARHARAASRRRSVEEPLADIDRFARFMRSTKAPPRDATLAATDAAKRGSKLFDATGCATCHVRNMVTARAGSPINGGTFTVPAALGNRLFHPFGDFLLHDVGTGDGIETAVIEHHGKAYAEMQEYMEPTANRLRTAPLWGLRMRSRLMHDGLSLTPRDAVLRHAGEAKAARWRFEALDEAQKTDLLLFLQTL